MARFTTVEQFLDERARQWLSRAPATGVRGVLTEILAFGVKQAWACVFGAAMLAVLFATRLWYPEDADLTRNDFVTIAAIVIQVVMVVTRLETLRELRVIILFHIVGTGMELFKTDVGSWAYEPGGILHLGAVPLYSGFMYAAVGSYMVRVYRLFDLGFDRYPRRWITALLAAGIYANFFTHHFIVDLRWLLLAGVIIVYARTTMHFRVFRGRLRMPLLAAFLLVAFFIWLAENIGTWSNAWFYPGQADGWEMVSLTKLTSWFLLMIISVVLVAWVYPPLPRDQAPVDVVGGPEEAQDMGKVEHFEIPADDVARAKAFYADVFDWSFDDWDDDTTMIKRGGAEGDTGVIGGDIHKRSEVPHPTVVITVDSIDDALAAVERSGGRRVGEIQPLGETARYAYFEDSEGNTLGVYEGSV